MRRSILQTKFYLLSVLLSLASCSQDELAEQDTALPDGMYPMTFTAVQVAPENTPQTRVSEEENGMSSRWDGGEIIKVAVSGKGNDMETTCTLDESGSITAYDPKLYWQNTNSATINAWYSNIAEQSTVTEKTVSLADQSGGLAYVLKAEETTAQYKDQKIKLKFSHQLAKVRVKLEKGSYQGNLSNATVKVKGYTSCTVMNGNVGDEGEVGYITMRKNGEYYEASLVPGTLQASEAFEISADDKNTKVNLQKAVVLEKGEVHTITITVNQNRNIDINSGSGDINITGDDEWIVYGNGNVAQRRITIDGSATVTLKNINLTNGSDGCICIKNGSPTIILEGTNKLGFKENGRQQPVFRLEENANITIQGNGILEIDANSAYSSECPGIGPGHSVKCGNITILDCTVKVYTTTAAGIGSSISGSCGDITIKNATIVAQGSPAIGAGQMGYTVETACGNILIENTNLTASVSKGYGYTSVVVGCGSSDAGATASCGTITIKHTGKTRAQILSTLTGGDPLIGKGQTNGTSTCGLITITSSDGTETYPGDTGVTN